MVKFLLFETASGYSLFKIKPLDDVGLNVEAVQNSIHEMERFSKIVTLHAFKPFSTAVEALEQVNSVSESLATDMLITFLTTNLPKVKEGKKAKYHVGVLDAKLGNAINAASNIPCTSGDIIGELARGVRTHFSHYVKQLEEHAWRDAQRGLAHSYSRAKVKFNVNRADNMIIQAISLLDTLDKDLNTFIMKVREWYGWHFPELAKVVNDNFQFARVVILAKDKKSINDDMLDDLVEIVGDKEIAEEIIQAAKLSMGQDISPIDMANIELFAKRVISLAEYRQKLFTYLHDRMHAVAPNLSALIGEVIGARLISHAGSLTNLAKSPASTVQILGAEKALFRALKTKGNTPKYGLIFHSTFIGRAKQRNKGRISRYLANKCSIATRIDAFMDKTTSLFGEKMRDQVEERLRFYDDGVPTKKNATVMQEAVEAFMANENATEADVADAVAPESDAQPMDAEDVEPAEPVVKKEKKKKKKRASTEMEAPAPEAEEAAAPPSGKKKKRKSKSQD